MAESLVIRGALAAPPFLQPEGDAPQAAWDKFREALRKASIDRVNMTIDSLQREADEASQRAGKPVFVSRQLGIGIPRVTLRGRLTKEE